MSDGDSGNERQEESYHRANNREERRAQGREKERGRRKRRRDDEPSLTVRPVAIRMSTGDKSTAARESKNEALARSVQST